MDRLSPSMVECEPETIAAWIDAALSAREEKFILFVQALGRLHAKMCPTTVVDIDHPLLMAEQVSSAIDAALAQAREEEREAIAKMVESPKGWVSGDVLAEKIRSRRTP